MRSWVGGELILVPDRHGAQRDAATGSVVPHETPIGDTFAPATAADLSYILGSWSEAYKLAGRNAKLNWAVYKRHVVPELAAVLAADDTRILAAYRDGVIVGWIAYSPGRNVDAVHWLHVRFRVGETGAPLRRHGLMTKLLEQAGIGHRVVYTHHGPKPRHRGGPSADVGIVKWLAGRGTTAIFVAYEEWKR